VELSATDAGVSVGCCGKRGVDSVLIVNRFSSFFVRRHQGAYKPVFRAGTESDF